jgi:hypothetical protein
LLYIVFFYNILFYSKKPKLLEQATLPLASVITKEENTVSLEMDTNKTNKQASDIDSEIDLPFKERKLPAYISLKTNTSKVKEDVVVILDSEQKQNGIFLFFLHFQPLFLCCLCPNSCK